MSEIDKAIVTLKKYHDLLHEVYADYAVFSKAENYSDKSLELASRANAVKNAVGTAITFMEHQLTKRWIPVIEKLPSNEERVLICSDRKRYNGEVMKIRTIAMYEDGTMHTDNSGFSWEDSDFDYDEETDDYIIPEGWYEQNMYSEEFGIVDDFVTHWMPLTDYPTVN
jgi:hypothetical protein